MRSIVADALKSSLADSSRVTCDSHLRFWQDFCAIAGLDEETCFAYDDSLVNLEVIKAEADLLCAFMGYIVAFPRRRKQSNSGLYARQVLSTVLSFYEDRIGRKPGCNAAGRQMHKIRCVAKGLRVLAPASKSSKVPVLQFHLRAIRSQLDLENNLLHRVCWAAWLMQWQGVLRSGDLIRGKGGRQRG